MVLVKYPAGKHQDRCQQQHQEHTRSGNCQSNNNKRFYRLGYSTFQESVRYYADANDLNFLQGFDVANGVASDENLEDTLVVAGR